MISQTTYDQVRSVAGLILRSQHVVAFTGAGISTESGIPDFRSEESGLWSHVKPMEVASIYGFKRNPKSFYDWMKPLALTVLNAEPNPAHKAIVDLEKMGFVKEVVTQNIDMLHWKAGSKRVFELHGQFRTATCINCFHKYDAEPILKEFLKTGEVPRCTHCREGVLKPDVILFGEQLPYQELQAAQDAARVCDLMIIVGSSLEVAPASDLPILAKRTGARIVIVNLEKTDLDCEADVVIHGRAAQLLPQIVREVRKQL